MSRIIDSCFQCSNRHLSGKGMYVCHFNTYRPKFLADYASELNTIPDFCPLPSLDDKLREAWDASRDLAALNYEREDVKFEYEIYEEWRRKQNANH